MLEIKSGDPNNSYVVWKLEGQGPNGEPIVDERMPLGMTPLTDVETKNIRDWISDGTPGCTAPKSSGTEGAVATRSASDSTNTLGSWEDVWNESLRGCTICHSINPVSPRCSTDFECPPNGLVLTLDNYSGVVDGHNVVPFDLERSILWQRITTGDQATRMPLGLAPLTQAQLDIVQHWIEDGARFCPENQVCQ